MFRVTSYGLLGAGCSSQPGHLVNELNEPSHEAQPTSGPAHPELPVVTLIRFLADIIRGDTVSVTEREYCHDGRWIIPLWLAKHQSRGSLGDNYGFRARHKPREMLACTQGAITRRRNIMSSESASLCLSRNIFRQTLLTWHQKLNGSWDQSRGAGGLAAYIGHKANFKRLCSQKMHKSRHSN